MITKKGQGLLILILDSDNITLQTADGYVIIQFQIKNTELITNNTQIIFGMQNEQYIVDSQYSQQIQRAYDIYTSKDQVELPQDPLFKCKVKLEHNIVGQLLFNKQNININKQSIKFSQIIIFTHQENVVNIVYRLDNYSNITNTIKLEFNQNEILLMFIYYAKNRQGQQQKQSYQDNVQIQTYQTIQDEIVSPQLDDNTMNTLDQYQQKQKKQSQYKPHKEVVIQEDNIPMIQIQPSISIDDLRETQQGQQELQQETIINDLNQTQTTLKTIQTQDYKLIKDLEQQQQTVQKDKQVQFQALNLYTNQNVDVIIDKKDTHIKLIQKFKKCCKQQVITVNDLTQINVYEYPSNAQGLYGIRQKAFDVKRNQMLYSEQTAQTDIKIPSPSQIKNEYMKQFIALNKQITQANKYLKKKQFFVIEIVNKKREIYLFGISKQEEYKQITNQLK